MAFSKNTTEELLQLMELEALEVNLFRGESRDIGTSRVFGGQVLAQSIIAASRTVDEGTIHSLHSYFLRAGDAEAPIVYDVDRNRDGRSFKSRRVVAIQHGRPIFTLAASFQLEQEGLDHQFEMPQVPMPEELSSESDIPEDRLAKVSPLLRRWFTRTGPFDFRPTRKTDVFNPHPQAPRSNIWFRLNEKIDVPDQMHRALMAYASDFHLVGTATLPHGISFIQDDLLMASLDHGMWFHRPVRVDDWLLYSCDSPSSSGGRGLARGLIYDRQGRLVASTIQEGMIRVGKRPDRRKS
ncbi:MAG: acyl-CoA thioesterase II [Xanthomonadales bacterium]|nr:acyl-CoA thioesterase II [Gammaproteobacteria bacterium]MBT8074801.1 acyl-CoA thioesterase II [Gammaproteobacteria bacterium]NNK05653.1 acyl-CoA thioesterase II [Xanthomonadales bacterium]NNK99967.1 acyl-CoA thioesterase II [Xanthomonadales bacterium]